jgi:hypothetical protein
VRADSGLQVFELLILILLSAVATEAVVEIITKSELFQPLMVKFSMRQDFFSRLVTCPYCLSVWVAMFFTGLLYFHHLGYILAIGITLVFSIHRLANLFHLAQDRLNVRGHQ